MELTAGLWLVKPQLKHDTTHLTSCFLCISWPVSPLERSRSPLSQNTDPSHLWLYSAPSNPQLDFINHAVVKARKQNIVGLKTEDIKLIVNTAGEGKLALLSFLWSIFGVLFIIATWSTIETKCVGETSKTFLPRLRHSTGQGNGKFSSLSCCLHTISVSESNKVVAKVRTGDPLSADASQSPGSPQLILVGWNPLFSLPVWRRLCAQKIH